MKTHCSPTAFLLFFPLLILFAPSWAQFYPETLWVPVTFYDFHADEAGTQVNPNFEERPNGDGVKRGMVQNTLDDNRKPMLAADKDHNDRVAEWFRPSGSLNDPDARFYYDRGERRWKWTNLEPYMNRVGEHVHVDFDSTYDMANIVIYDSLPFVLIDADNGTYVFENTHGALYSYDPNPSNPLTKNDTRFMPLNGRGFGAEPYNGDNVSGNTEMNYSFTMEIHSQLTYREGLTFEFRGDDDVWAFIDGKLAMDLGGIHGPEPGTVDLGSLGLVEGQKYDFDFFYAERHTSGSNIKITTNILSPGILLLEFIGDTVLTAGVAEPIIRAIVKNEAGESQQIDDRDIEWSIVDPVVGDSLYTATGDTATVYAERAHRFVEIRARYVDPESGIPLLNAKDVWVEPAAPAAVIIEELAGGDPTTADLNTPHPVDTIRLPWGQQEATAYALLRDRFGNFVSTAGAAVWESTGPGNIAVNPTPGAIWTGAITRGSGVQVGATVPIHASQAGLTPGTAIVVVQSMVQVDPPVVLPAGQPTHTYEKSVAVELAAPASFPTASVYYCTGCTGITEPDDTAWIRYTGTPLVLNSFSGDTLRAYAVVDQPGYLPSTIREDHFKRIPGPVYPPRAIPGTRSYAHAMTALLQLDERSRPTDTIFYQLLPAGEPAPIAGGTGWLRFDGSSIPLSDSVPLVLYAYTVNDEASTSTVIREIYTNTDYRGPEIASVRYYLGNPPSYRGPRRRDTLVVAFSEPVPIRDLKNASATAVFEYFIGNEERSDRVLADYEFDWSKAQPGDTMVSAVTITLPDGRGITPGRDQMRITPGTLGDLHGNRAPVDGSRQVVTWGRDYDILVEISPNPGIYGAPETRIPDIIRNAVGPEHGSLPQYGTIVKATAIDAIDADIGRSHMVIYDVAGNVVRSGLPVHRLVNDPYTYIIAWNYRNERNRFVGIGTYLGVITLSYKHRAGGKVVTQKIGVKR